MVMRLQGEDAFCYRYKLATTIREDHLSVFIKTKKRATVLPWWPGGKESA